MRAAGQKIETIDDYIKSFPKEVQKILRLLRATIKKAAPQAGEKISYGIPAFTLHGNLVYFGGFKDHVSLFPMASGVRAFKKELARYECTKGTIQFPLDKPLPLAPITR